MYKKYNNKNIIFLNFYPNLRRASPGCNSANALNSLYISFNSCAVKF